MIELVVVLLGMILSVMFGFLAGLYITGVNTVVGVGWLVVGLLLAVQMVLASRGRKDE